MEQCGKSTSEEVVLQLVKHWERDILFNLLCPIFNNFVPLSAP